MTATPSFATDAAVGAGDAAVPTASVAPFVLNLCSSTTPMALAQTDLAELKRFTFFVSRRFEEGRERFRLHMGYFATLAEAEEWLNVVREIYPGAWAGEAPGRKLRERAAAAQAAQAQHAAGPQPSVIPSRPLRAPVAIAAPPPLAAPEPQIPPGMSPLDAALSLRVPVLKAAPPAAPAPPARPAVKVPPPAPAAVAPPVMARKAAPAVAAVTAAPAPTAAAVPPRKPAPPVVPKAAAPAAPAAVAAQKAPTAQPAAPRASMPASSARPATAAPAVAEKSHSTPALARSEAPAKSEPLALASDEKPKGVFGDSNVREVLKALGDASATGETRLMRAPPPLPPPAPAKELTAAPAKKSLSDTQVLKLLETRRPEGAESQGADPAHGAIPLLKPDDTGTREALKDAVTQDAPVLFAVQLQWSVQPVELDKVPPLAIFSAYTLYTVEGSRDSRKWFGLRLGFFSDAISAKQVAHYVRSEFASVAVVPVSSQEKARATDQDKQAATLNTPIAAPGQRVDEFKLIDDDTAQTEVAKLRAAAAAAVAPAHAPKPLTDGTGRTLPGRPIPKVAVGRAVTQPTAAVAASPPPAPAAAATLRGRARSPGRVGAGEKRGAQSLEETLEILGASQLSIDNGTGETLNESGVRHLRVEVQKNSPFSKLLERLSERMKKP
jgi:hypothetical protein